MYSYIVTFHSGLTEQVYADRLASDMYEMPGYTMFLRDNQFVVLFPTENIHSIVPQVVSESSPPVDDDNFALRFRGGPPLDRQDDQGEGREQYFGEDEEFHPDEGEGDSDPLGKQCPTPQE